MTRRQQDPPSRLSLPYNMARSRSTQNPVLPNKQLLNTIRSTNLSNQLHNFGVVVASIACDDQGGAFRAFRDGEKDASYEGFGVVWLLEGGDFFTEAGSGGIGQ